MAKLAELSDREFLELAKTSPRISVGSYESLKCRTTKDAVAIFGNPKSSRWDGIHFVGAGAKMFSHDVCSLIKSSGCLVKVGAENRGSSSISVFLTVLSISEFFLGFYSRLEPLAENQYFIRKRGY